MKSISSKLEIVSKCPVCGSSDTALWCIANDFWMRTTEQDFNYNHCSVCGSLFMSLRPHEKEINLYYNENYQPYLSSIPKNKNIRNIINRLLLFAAHQFRSKKLIYIQNNFYSRVTPKDRFVDFGCGAGKFLNIIQTTGCETIGVDFSDLAIETVLKNNHLGFTVDKFWTEVQDQSVNFLRMNHVVEHLYQPRETFKRIYSKMSHRGQLHIAVPNPNGLSSKLFRNYWYGLECPRHIILYKPETLIELLKECQFGEFEVAQESITKDLIRSIVFYLIDKGLIKAERFQTFTNSILLDLFLGPLMKLASSLGYGDRYHIFCKRV